jgi:hypothetical protein
MVEAGKDATSPHRLGKDAIAPGCAVEGEDVRGGGGTAAWRRGGGKRRWADHSGALELETAAWHTRWSGGGRRRARSSPVGRRRPPACQIPADTSGGVAGRASSDRAGGGVNGWGCSVRRCGGVRRPVLVASGRRWG